MSGANRGLNWNSFVFYAAYHSVTIMTDLWRGKKKENVLCFNRYWFLSIMSTSIIGYHEEFSTNGYKGLSCYEHKTDPCFLIRKQTKNKTKNNPEGAQVTTCLT